MSCQVSHCHSERSKLPCKATSTGRGLVTPRGTDTIASRNPATGNLMNALPALNGGKVRDARVAALVVVGLWGGAIELPASMLFVVPASKLGALAASVGVAGARTVSDEVERQAHTTTSTPQPDPDHFI